MLSQSNPTHVHIGTGKLGLGLIGDITADVGLRSVFLNREHPDSLARNARLAQRKSYLLRTEGGEKRVQVLDVRTFGEDYQQVLEVITGCSVHLLTISVGWENTPDLIRPILWALNERYTVNQGLDCPLCVILCENVAKASERFRALLEKRAKELSCTAFLKAVNEGAILFCNATVDRVCSKKIQVTSDDVVVTAESYRRWVIEKVSGPTITVEQLFDGNGDVVFTDRIDAHEKLKLWGVNGLHLAVAILARNCDPQIDMIDDAVDAPELREQIMSVVGELSEALHLAFPHEFSRDWLRKFFEKTLSRFGAAKGDPTTRILKDLELGDDRVNRLVAEGLKRIAAVFAENREPRPVMEETLRWAVYTGAYVFVGKVKDRLGEPLTVLLQKGRSAPCLMAIFPQVILLMDIQGRRLF